MKSDNDKYPVMTPEELEWESLKLAEKASFNEITKEEFLNLYKKLRLDFLLQDKTIEEWVKEQEKDFYSLALPKTEGDTA